MIAKLTIEIFQMTMMELNAALQRLAALRAKIQSERKAGSLAGTEEKSGDQSPRSYDASGGLRKQGCAGNVIIVNDVKAVPTIPTEGICVYVDNVIGLRRFCVRNGTTTATRGSKTNLVEGRADGRNHFAGGTPRGARARSFTENLPGETYITPRSLGG